MHPVRMLMLLVAVALVVASPLTAAQDTTPPTVGPVTPGQDTLIRDDMPVITAKWSDPSGIDLESVRFLIDRLDYSNLDDVVRTPDGLTFAVPEVFRLSEGNHTVTVAVSDTEGNQAIHTWGFEVNTTRPSGPTQGREIDILTIVVYVLIVTAIVGLALGVYFLYLRSTRGFTLKKYFAQHPLQKDYLVIYIPGIVAFLFVINAFGLIGADPDPGPFAYEYALIAGVFIAATAYAVNAQLELRRVSRYERSFSQFLFEMADAMRGGIDPAKAVVELSKTTLGSMRKPLRVAADGIRIGRPFEEMLEVMAKPMKSGLINRYSSLIGEAAKIGGETSVVIHRAAKDMDDLIKIEQERRRQLGGQTMTIYIALVVLLVVLYELVTIYPSMSDINVSLFGGGDLGSAAGAATTTLHRMSFDTLKRRFLHMMVINGLGSGLLIGKFTEGRVRYGLIHSLVMTAASVLFFVILMN